MSEIASEVRKRKAVLPVCLAVAACLAGGGYFGMRLKNPAPEQVRLGPIYKLGEFVVNLDSDPDVYLRAEIAVQGVDRLRREDLDAMLPALQDRLVQALSRHRRNDLIATKRDALKREVAAELNALLPAAEPRYLATVAKEAARRTDWSSATGPVVKVFFTSLVTQ